MSSKLFPDPNDDVRVDIFFVFCIGNYYCLSISVRNL